LRKGNKNRERWVRIHNFKLFTLSEILEIIIMCTV
jgi:hypothetical protein